MEEELISLESLSDFFQNSINLPELRNSFSSIFGNAILDSIYIGEACHYDIENGFILSAYIGLPINIELTIPSINLIKIKLGLPSQQLVVSKFTFFFQLIENVPSWRLFLRDINLSIVFDNNILRRVSPDDSEPVGSEVILKTGISIDQNSNFFIEPAEASLPLSYIGTSDFKISAEKVKFNLSPNNPQVSLKKLKFIAPQDLFPDSMAMPEFAIEDAVVNKNGFTGTILVEWNLNYESNKFLLDVQKEDGSIERKESTFLTIPGGIKYFKIQFENNIPISSDIKGLIRLPYFDQDIAIEIIIGDNGNFKIKLDSLSENGVLITKEDLIALYLKNITIDQDTSAVFLSGGLEPLLYASEGMKWLRMDVKNLKIDSTGKFSIDEAWLDLKELATLDLFGFKLELRKIGLGTLVENSTDKLWIDLSGSLKLIDQIPIGLDVEGFRILWPQNKNIQQFTPNDIGIQFKGVQFSFGVPGAIQLDGLIRFIKDENVTAFAGDMVLVIPAAGITAEAGLMVGMNSEQPNPYPFFYVYFGLEAAAGIPLGQSGLALKGAIGLFGINVSPNRQEGQNWYYDWYKKAPAPGAHQTTKWGDERDALAVGAGVTITTVDGVVKGTKGIIVLALPGPILVINGKALILDGLNPNPNAEPPFSATAIFDGKEKIVQFNIEAQAEIVEDMVDAYAAVEAFFDFKDVTNWHLYLGQDEPRDRRIKANVLNIIEADAYLMLDMLDTNSPRARMGIEAAIKPKIDNICFDIPLVGEQCIKFDAHINIGGNGKVSVQPEQFSGNAFIDAGIGISALGFELEIAAEVDISVEGPSPFSLQGDLELYANLPDPLPDYEDTFRFELKIPKVEIKVNDPLAEVSLFSRFTTESKKSTIYSGRIDEKILDDKDENGNYLVPMVQCDVNPILSFEHEMNQSTAFLMSPEGQKKYDVGAVEFTPSLNKVVIRERDKKEGSSWQVIYSTVASDRKPIIGTWLAESDPSSPSRPASKRLQLLTLNPLSNTMHSTGMIGYLMMQSEAESKHLSELVLEDYPELICKDTTIKPHCLDFRYSGKPIIFKKINWSKVKLSSNTLIEISENCLNSENDLKVIFPERVYSVTITFCNKPENVEIKALYNASGKELKSLIKESEKNILLTDISFTKESVININAISSNSVQTITSAAYFECLQLSTKDREGLKIKSICYTTIKAKKDSEINQKLCESNRSMFGLSAPQNQTGTNSNPFLGNSIFRPGMYYEIEVKSILEAEVMPNRIKETDPLINLNIKNIIIDKYNSIIDNLPSLTSRFAYFQTDAPPQNLEPYIKWSIPAIQESSTFVNDPLQIRFKRGYLNVLFSNSVMPKYRAKVFFKDVSGVCTPITEAIGWLVSESSTLFPDEETWNDYLVSNNLPTPTKKDDVLSISLNKPNLYKPNNRYELLLVGMEREDIILEEDANKVNVIKINGKYYNLLASRSFKTSRFDSFVGMLKSANAAGEFKVVNNTPTIFIKSIVEQGSNVNWNFNFSGIVKSELEYYKGLVDYEFGIVNLQKGANKLVSKEALEELKILHRNQKDKLDEAFRINAMGLNKDIFFKDEGNILNVYAIRSNGRIGYIWVKLPEKINLKFNVNAIGSCNVKLNRRNIQNGIDNRFKYTMLCNSDTSQLIFKLNQPINTKLLESIGIEFSKVNDHKDEITNANLFGPNKNKHHRYDRPSLKQISDQIIELKIRSA